MLLVLRDQGALVGLLSDQEIIGHLATHGPAALRRGVRNAMLVSFPIATPEDSVMYIMRVMTEQRVRHLPVVAKGIVMGVISIGDVLKSQLVEKDEETAVLRDIARSRVAMAA
jgi:CBS domain-containing protein